MPDNADPRPRTIDERLDGLTQTLEIIAAMQRDNEKRFQENQKRFEDNEKQWNKRFTEIAAAIQQGAENIRALARIAEIHEHRITGIEGPRQ